MSQRTAAQVTENGRIANLSGLGRGKRLRVDSVSAGFYPYLDVLALQWPRFHLLFHLFAAVWVGSREISSNPPGENGWVSFSSGVHPN
jgi:hypothetical protein